jgi:diguanylate cyclase (GGDEF)-like protein
MVHGSYNVLLVDEVPLLAKVTEHMLKKSVANQYALIHEKTVAHALVTLKAVNFDVILVDLNLPNSEEMGALSALLEAAPETPVIVLTATQKHEVGYKAIKLGAEDFLIKGEFNFLTLDRAIVFAIERHRLQRTIRQLAVMDELTGLYNRRGFNSLHPDILEHVRDSESRGYLCYFDLDLFKQINDELGHQKGDDALAEFASKLRSIFPKDALLARLGGDEFAAMGLEASPGQAQAAVNALFSVLEARNRMKPPYRLEASAGLALFDRTGSLALPELAAAADAALYREKQHRRKLRERPSEPAPARPQLQPVPIASA